MAPRNVTQRVQAMAISEGAGVIVHRSIGVPALRYLDPFLMLDHFSSDNPDDYIAGFPEHPHRGFITLTYMLNGHMEHQDSMGNRGDLRAGGAQWMKAASGVIHSEMPRQISGLMQGFQLWINLPGSEKMSDPAYQEFESAAIPKIDFPGGSVRLLSGLFRGQRGPIRDLHTDVQYLDIELAPQASFVHPLPPDKAAFLYVFVGDVAVSDETLPQHGLAVLGTGDEARIVAGVMPARLILVAGRPLGEPIVQYGPFVMNTREQIDQALADYRTGHLVRRPDRATG